MRVQAENDMQAALDLLSSPVCNAALQQAVVARSVKPPVPSLNQVCCRLHGNMYRHRITQRGTCGKIPGRKGAHNQADSKSLPVVVMCGVSVIAVRFCCLLHLP